MQTLFLNAAITDATRPEPRMGNVLVEDGVIRDVEANSRRRRPRAARPSTCAAGP